MATTATTTTYQYPYPLGGDSLSNVATRIKELADRSEIVTAQIVSGNITLAPGTIYNASIAAAAAISYSKLDLTGAILNADLAGSIAPSKITGTAITAADTGTVTSTMLLDGTILNADVNASAAIDKTKISGTAVTIADTGTVTGTMIASSVALAGNPTTTTQAQSNNSTRVATTAYVDAYVTGTVPDDSLTNVKINSAAAIAYSKLNLATSIVNTDVSASAAIAYSKLNLAASVTSADIVSVTLNQIPSYQTYRNVIINGGMQVTQRGTSTPSITTTGYYTADRWVQSMSALGTWTQTVVADAPTGSGFNNSLKVLCTTAAASPAAASYMLIAQNIEGYNVQHFLKGSASAKAFAVSFWVKSNVTGNFVLELNDTDNSRSCSAIYNIAASATWEKKTLIFPVDTTGAFTNDNNLSLELNFFLDTGSNWESGTLNTVWATNTTANRVVGGASVASAVNNYWQVTGVQLEVGSVATPFEFEPYETTLRKCHRYFTRYTDAGNGFFPQSLGHTDLAGRPEVTIQYTEKRSDSVAITFSSAAAISVQNIMTGTAYNSTGLNFYAGFNRFCATLFIDTGAAAPVNVPYQAALRTSAYMDISSEL